MKARQLICKKVPLLEVAVVYENELNENLEHSSPTESIYRFSAALSFFIIDRVLFVHCICL